MTREEQFKCFYIQRIYGACIYSYGIVSFSNTPEKSGVTFQSVSLIGKALFRFFHLYFVVNGTFSVGVLLITKAQWSVSRGVDVQQNGECSFGHYPDYLVIVDSPSR